MAAYQQSTSTLKTILANPNLDLEHVERTTEALAEVMSNQEEIDSAVRIGGEVAVGSGGVVDDDDLKRELEEMVKEEKEVQRVKDAEAKLAEQARASQEEKEEVAVPVTTIGSLSTGTGPKTTGPSQAEVEAEKVWRERYEEAQQRKREEGERAEMERIKKQARMAAE
jgi:charged multivesicular body protein 7